MTVTLQGMVQLPPRKPSTRTARTASASRSLPSSKLT